MHFLRRSLNFTKFRSVLRQRKLSTEASFGVLFDIDGVLARGHLPLAEAKEAFSLLRKAAQKIPVAFVTNAMSLHSYKAKQLSDWLQVEVHPSQLVMAHTPLRIVRDLHQQNCLFIGQGPLKEIAAEIGFENVCTIEEIAAAYPLLDVADHDKRLAVASGQVHEEMLPQIQSIVLLGEPKHWETPLQLLVDLLLTFGRPWHSAKRQMRQSLPVIACNLDLQYMHRATFPRYGHGAFLLCLEALFKKVTRHELQYDLLIGKPSEITFRYAEHVICSQLERPHLRSLYMIGDNPEVDIGSANLYQRFINGASIPPPRIIPSNADLSPQTVDQVHGILVKTGVYQGSNVDSRCTSHRDFSLDAELCLASAVHDNVFDALLWILEREGVCSESEH